MTFQDRILEPFPRSESLPSDAPKTRLGNGRASVRDPQWTTAIFSLECRSGADELWPALAMERFDAFTEIVG
jgi:hypothetical protein